MKFSHIADVHIGSWRDPKMKELSTKAFINAMDESFKEEVDFILVAGDLFNTSLPGIDLVKVAVKKLKEAKVKGIPVYYIAGSHDYSPSGKTMLDVIEEAGLGVDVMRGSVDEKEVLKLRFTVDERTGAKITGIIGRRGMLEKKYYESLDKENLEVEKGFKIFMFHTALDELKPEDLKDMASNPVSFLPKGFDYYAGGHVHIVKKKDLEEHGYKNIVYPGPTFPASFSELEKLGTGGFYVYDDGKFKRKELNIKNVKKFKVNVNNRNPGEAYEIIKEAIDTDVGDCIALLRVEGTLINGKTTDIPFQEIVKILYEKGAYHVLKNTTKLSSEEFKEVKSSTGTQEETEYKIIREHLSNTNIFKDEETAIKELMRTMSSEKHEGEKQTDYEERIISEANTLLEKQRKKN